MYEGDRTSIDKGDVVMPNKIEEKVTLEEVQEEYGEAVDIFPALHKYKADHSTVNLQKLCVEVASFCRAIYASTRNDAERNVYFAMLDKLNKK